MFELAEKGLMRVVQHVLNFLFCLFIEHQVYAHCTCTFVVRSFEIYKAAVSVNFYYYFLSLTKQYYVGTLIFL